MNIHAVAVPVAVATTGEVLRVNVEHFEELGLSITNNTVNALDAFQLLAMFSKEGPEVPLATIAGDFSTPLWPLRRADAMVTLAGSATGKLFMNVAGIHTLILKASANTTITNLGIDGQAL